MNRLNRQTHPKNGEHIDMDKGRRTILKTGIKAAALAAIPERINALNGRAAAGPNDRVRVGIVGLRGRGEEHIKAFGALHNVEIAALCDIDDSVLSERLAQVRKMRFPARTYTDVRRLLDDNSMDAVSIATPHHWHALIAIWAMQAGKDVYIEKPCSHNLWEGRQLIRATARYNRIVQHGTQSRSAPAIMDAMKKLHQDSVLGDVYLSRGLCFKWRDTIGHTPVSPVPPGVDYNLWTGPASAAAVYQKSLPLQLALVLGLREWRLGNQGIHQLDIARWGLGPGFGFPDKISAVGGHVMFDDDQQTPNVLNCAFEYNRPNGKRVLLEFEVRHWITNHEAEIGAHRLASAVSGEKASGGLGPAEGSYNSVGNIFYGPLGLLAVDNSSGYKTYLGKDQHPGPSSPLDKEDHFANFISCVVSRKKEDLRAPIEEGHLSSGLAHLANASYRLGRTLNFDPDTELVKNDDEANLLLRDSNRGYRSPFVIPDTV